MSTMAGKRIVITRATHQTQPFQDLLLAHQAIPVLYPSIAIVPPPDTAQLDDCLTRLETFDWVIFTSRNTIYSISDRLQTADLHPDWSKVKIAVVGSKTGDALQEHMGCQADFVPESFTGENLARTLPIEPNTSIFLPQSELADDTLTDHLSQRGATVTTVTAYQTVIGIGGDDVPTMLQQNKIDMLTFTSPSSVKNFLSRISPLKPYKLPVVCIGPTTEQAAYDAGFTNCFVPHAYTLDGMVATIVDYFST